MKHIWLLGSRFISLSIHFSLLVQGSHLYQNIVPKLAINYLQPFPWYFLFFHCVVHCTKYRSFLGLSWHVAWWLCRCRLILLCWILSFTPMSALIMIPSRRLSSVTTQERSWCILHYWVLFQMHVSIKLSRSAFSNYKQNATFRLPLIAHRDIW